MNTRFLFHTFTALAACSLAFAGELLPPENHNPDNAPEPPPATDGSIAIEFATPPTDGTISLGVYAADGKLVRVLRTEATAADFEVGLNGLIARWDGKSDAGETVPDGTYSARGMVVGDLVIEGEAYLGNDWIGDDGTPRLKKVIFITAGPDAKLGMMAEDSDGTFVMVQVNAEGEIFRTDNSESGTIPEMAITSDDGTKVALTPAQVFKLLSSKEQADFRLPGPVDDFSIGSGEKVIVQDGKLQRWQSNAWQPFELPELGRVISIDFSSSGTLWLIDKTGDRTDVKEYSLDGKFLRHLGIAPDAPQPVQIVSARDGRLLYLREENARETRVRALALVGSRAEPGPGAEEISTWETVFSQSIRPAATAEEAAPLLDGFKPEPTVEVALRENALQPDRTGERAALRLLERKGSTVLGLADGLPLQTIARTNPLKWSQLGRRGRGDTLTVVQSDGLVIEEFSIHRPGNLTSFDAGEYRFPKELPAPKEEQNLPEPKPASPEAGEEPEGED